MSGEENDFNVKTTDLAGIGADLLNTMPQVSDNAIVEHEAQERKNDASINDPSANGLPVDKNGKEYNPETHELSPLTGKAIKKRRGAKPAPSGGARSSVVVNGKPVQQNAQAAQQEAVIQQGKATGRFAAHALIGVCVGIFGNEFKPVKDAERDEVAYLESAFSEYFIATGATDLPPSVVLLIATGAYIMPRFTQPITKSKLARAKDWAIGKFFSWRAGRDVKKGQSELKGDENA